MGDRPASIILTVSWDIDARETLQFIVQKKRTGNIVSTGICDVSQWQTKMLCLGKNRYCFTKRQFQTKVYVDLYFRNFAAYYWRFQSVTVTLSTPFTCYRQFPALVMFYSPALLVREYHQLKEKVISYKLQYPKGWLAIAKLKPLSLFIPLS